MSETLDGRQPVQLAEIQFPRCANEYGCGPCEAGLGNVSPSDLVHNFARDGLGIYTASLNSVLTKVPGGYNVRHTSTAPFIQSAITANTVNGNQFRYVTVHVTMVDRETAPTVFLFYSDAATGTFTADKRMSPITEGKRWRGRNDTDEVLHAGKSYVFVFDAATSVDYATRWQGNNIERIRFRLSATVNTDYIIHSISFSSESLFDNRGRECFKTFATCQDQNNYRATPWGNETASNSYADGDTIDPSVFDRQENCFFVCDLECTDLPFGTIFAVGSGSGSYAYLGRTDTEIVGILRNNGTSPVRLCRARFDRSLIANRSVTLIFDNDKTNDKLRLWEWDKIARQLTLLDEAESAVAFGTSVWTTTTNGQVGGDGGNTYGSEGGGNWDGIINYVEQYDSQDFQASIRDVYRNDLYFGRDQMGKPTDDIHIIPALKRLRTSGSEVNISGSNRNLEPLGARAFVEMDMYDAPMSDLFTDPYATDRSYDVTTGDRGLFWERLRVREKFGKLGAVVNVYDGYAYQQLASYRKRTYILDRMDLPQRQNVRLRARDILSLSELRKAQMPEVTTGALEANITAGATSFGTTGHLLTDYPSSGTVRINDECMTYSAIADDGDGTFTWTISGRGTDGTTAAEHEASDTLQLCERFDNVPLDDALLRLLNTGAKVARQYLDLDGWADEYESYLASYNMDALITEPTGVNQLLGEMLEQSNAFMWWDERTSKVKLRAMRPVTDVPPLLTDADHFIADSMTFAEKPEERVTQVWVFHDQLDPTVPLDERRNWRKVQASGDLDLQSDDQYGQSSIRRIFARFLPDSGTALQSSSRLLSRYADVTVEATFEVDAKDRAYWVGDVFRISHYRLLDQFGKRDEQRIWIITYAEEIVPGERIRYKAQDATLAGFVVRISGDGQGDHTGDLSDDGLYGFITDDAGLAGDGSEGSKIV